MTASGVDLKQIGDELTRRRVELKVRADRIERDLHRAEGALSPAFSEQAVQVQNDETLAEIGRATAAEIRSIDEALARIAAGTYGVCKRCQGPIEAARLAVRPEAVTCIHCDQQRA
jgi:RNA polymerase-binding transcription factor DksA